MRYLEVTHKYVLPVSADDEEALDAIAQQGVSIMENFILSKASNIRDLRSDWTLMPREYSSGDPGDEQPTMIQTQAPPSDYAKNRAAGMGVNHPWDEGVRITPPDHPFAAAETGALYEEGMLCGPVENAKPGFVCILVKGHVGPHYLGKLPTEESPTDTIDGQAKEITDGES